METRKEIAAEKKRCGSHYTTFLYIKPLYPTTTWLSIKQLTSRTAAWHVVNGNTATKQYGCIGMACCWHYFTKLYNFVE